MWCGRRCAKEWQESGSLGARTIRSGVVGLLKRRTAIRTKEEITGGDRRPIRVVEDLARSIRTEGLDRIRGSAYEGPRSGLGDIPGNGSHRERARRGIV